MTKEDFKRHHFGEHEMVMHEGKPAEVISTTDRGVYLRIGWQHYKTVLPADIELMDNKQDNDHESDKTIQP